MCIFELLTISCAFYVDNYLTHLSRSTTRQYHVDQSKKSETNFLFLLHCIGARYTVALRKRTFYRDCNKHQLFSMIARTRTGGGQ